MMNKDKHHDSDEDILDGPLQRHFDMAEEDEEEDTEDDDTQSSVNPEISKGKIPKISKTPNKTNKDSR